MNWSEEGSTERVHVGLLSSGRGLPVVAEPSGIFRENRAEEDGGALSVFDHAVHQCVEANLTRSGAILFRGFPIGSAARFAQFIQMISPGLLDYEFGSTPRSRVLDQIYTSTEYPAHQQIPLHNEQSYAREWPMKIWFYCQKPAEEGGETPIADSREVFKRIDSRIRMKFEEKRVMYVRNYGNGLDVSWQKVFGTNDRSAVEAFCRSRDIAFEWKKDGELRTRQVCQAVAVHPLTGESVWFNQAHLFHLSNLEPHLREALLAAVPEEDLPRNAYYGDGSAIEPSVLGEIRQVYREAAVWFSWQKGDVLLLDNMLVAHGRASFKGARKILVSMADPFREKSEVGS